MLSAPTFGTHGGAVYLQRMKYAFGLTVFVSALVLGFLPSRAEAAPTPFGLPRVTGRDRFHRVQRGQNLMAIARHYGLALDHLSMANRLPAQLRVPVGRRLVIPGRRILPLHPPANGLVVNLPERVAYLFRSGRLAAFYPIAIGRPGFETPVGQFRIISRVKNPTWLPPEWAGKGEIVVPAGPDNPLGDRWIGLSAKGIGLHATTDVPSVGGNASHGCMRMYPRAAHQLFTLVKVGMPVRIEYETARMGWDPEKRRIVIATFPDVYHKRGPVSAARRLLHQAGLDVFVDSPRILRLATRETGVIHPVLSVADVWLKGHPARPATRPALIVNGHMWLPSDLLKAAGLQLQMSSDRSSIQVHRGPGARIPQGVQRGTQVFRVTRAPAATKGKGRPAAVLAAGRAWFPASEVFRSFAGPWQWDATRHRLQVATDPD